MKLPQNSRKYLFLILLALTIVETTVLQIIDIPLKTSVAPGGIVSYELAENSQVATQILASWDARAQLHAAFSLGFDFLYILSYTLTLIVALLWLAEDLPEPWQRSGKILAWGMIVAGVADMIENYYLWYMLVNGVSEFAAKWASRAAWLKFILIGMAIFYIILELKFIIRRKVFHNNSDFLF